MSDVNCPYCRQAQEICHDDGYGYEEDCDYKQDCVSCGKPFGYQTRITFLYYVFCVDGKHDMDGKYCKNCDYYEPILNKVTP